jgi:hypothetical protein
MAKSKSKAKSKSPMDHVGTHQDKHAADEIGGPIKSVFKDHAWPASRKTLIAHARQHEWFSKADLARLEKIPDRRYKSVVDVANAVRMVEPGMDRARPGLDEVGEVKTPQGNRMAQGSLRAEAVDGQRSKASYM